MSAHGIPDVKCRRAEFLPGWTELCRMGDRLRVQGVGTPLPDDMERARLSGSTPSGFPKRTRAAMLSRFPQGEAHDTREHHTRTTAYPIRICCLDHWLPPPSCPDIFYSLRSGSAYGKGLQSFGSSCFWAFHCFVMDSKELSLITDCFGDQKAIKTPKLNTILLELIAKVLNMLIGLKGANYYSKVFKWVNYKLSNSTLWVVIRPSPYSPLPL